MEKEKLRRVTFRLCHHCGFIPDQTEEDVKEQMVHERESTGYFHEWAIVSDEDGSFYIRKVGIVEEEGTGKVFYVVPDLIQFIDKPYETK
ncbi:MAG: hypothetical protein IKI60_03225 [Alloprevotella sp.]|nr:hypothetical protein [Alloprevotella sp.]